MGWEINICCCPNLGCRPYFIILKKQKGFDKGILLICSQIDQTIDHNHYEAVMQQKQDIPRIPLIKSPWQYTYGQIGLINQGWVHVTVRKVNTLFHLMIENKSTQGGTSLELNQPTPFYLFRILKIEAGSCEQILFTVCQFQVTSPFQKLSFETGETLLRCKRQSKSF